MRLLVLFLSCLLYSGLSAEQPDSRFSIEKDGSLIFGGGLKLPRLASDGEWRYFGAQARAGRELLRFSFVREGLREVSIDLSYSPKLSSGVFEQSRLSGFLAGFCVKEGLSEGKEEEMKMTLAGSVTTRTTRSLAGKSKTYYFAAYLVSRSPYTTIWVLAEDAARVFEYQLQIEKL